LAHAVERALLLSHDERIDLDDLPEDVLRRSETSENPVSPAPSGSSGDEPASEPLLPEAPGSIMTLDDVMKDAVCRSLEEARGDCARAARMLGISRPAIYRKMVRYGITRSLLHQYRSHGPHRRAPGIPERAAGLPYNPASYHDFVKSRPTEKPAGGFCETASGANPGSPTPERQRQ